MAECLNAFPKNGNTTDQVSFPRERSKEKLSSYKLDKVTLSVFSWIGEQPTYQSLEPLKFPDSFQKWHLSVVLKMSNSNVSKAGITITGSAWPRKALLMLSM